ncbi:Squalene phytoene synthase [Echinococcus multilocularis]|uniref:Squalene phytoene synthase n=1 Tax=Echinococcus multilocularis TaxID=6211 RepID=A0A068YG42_ECHMU|nr:Squalene phytoene synthase [Echinococcus multilocularis]
MMVIAGLRNARIYGQQISRSVSSKSYSHQDYCCNLVRKADFYNYLCCLALPQPQRRFAFAFRAFNVEIALIRDRAPTPQTTNLRFQYWEDFVQTLIDSRGVTSGMLHRSPIEAELDWAVNRFDDCLSRHWLLRLLHARRNRPGDVAFRDCAELEEYAESTNAPIHYGLAEAFGLKSLEVDHALSHLAKAQGLITHLRSIVPLVRQYRALLLPTDLLVQHDLPAEIALRLCLDSSDASVNPQAVERLRDICQVLATLARNHAARAVVLRSRPKTDLKTRQKSLLPLLLLPSVPVCRLLRALSACNFDPRHPRWLQPREGLMPLRVAWHAMRGTSATPPHLVFMCECGG